MISQNTDDLSKKEISSQDGSEKKFKLNKSRHEMKVEKKQNKIVEEYMEIEIKYFGGLLCVDMLLMFLYEEDITSDKM